MADNYNLLIRKLDEFIRKHYLNRLLRGLIYSSAIILATFIILNVVEYNYYLSTAGRKILFFGFLGGSAALLYKLVAEPLLHFYRLGKIISHEQAAQVIGTHFSSVQDRLLNILQLKKQSETLAEKELIEASINQKIESIRLVPFASAIDLGKNRRYLRYLILPVLVFLAIMIGAPDIIKDGTTRLIHNSTSFEKPAPFKFTVNNPSLRVMQFEDLVLDVTLKGNVLPENVFIKVEGYAYKMQKKNAAEYQYHFINLQRNQEFVLTAAGYDSKPYTIEVMPKPMIVNFDVKLDYPAYTGKKDEILRNIGDLNVPEGTKAQWELNTSSTSAIIFRFSGKEAAAVRRGEALFILDEVLMLSGYYTVKISNEHLKDADSITYSITVVPDMHPSISVQPLEDSATLKYLYFMGEISDDYGLSKLQLKYKIQKENGEESSEYTAIPVPFTKGQYSQFSHYWDLSTLGLQPGEGLIYFFEVWDNDGIHGSKSTRSTVLQYKLPSREQLEKETRQSNEELKNDLDKSITKADELRKEIQETQEKLLQKKNLSWEDKKSIEDLLEKQKSLQEAIRQMQEEFNNNISRQQEYKNMNEDILRKQQKLQELFNEVLTPEMKELFDKLNSLLDEMNLDEMMENLKDFELTQEQLENELDRMLELFKKLEFEQKLSETIDRLTELAKKQEKLSEETKNESKSSDELSKEQEKLNEEFDQVQESLKELEDIKKELGDENAFNDTKEDAKQVEQEMSKSSENIQQNKNKKASESQQKAAEKMQEMSDQLARMMEQMQLEELELDMEAIRQLLENLVTLSFDQEELMKQVQEVSINDPKYVSLAKKQQDIKDDTEMVKDSLFALSKRVFQLQTFINKEVAEVSRNIEKSIDELAQRQKQEAAMHQQYVMTGFNNLALMLSETLQQMQQQMASQMPGSQMCQKKGKGMPTPKLSQLQQQLNDQITQMQESLKKGPQGNKGKGGMSKELAEQAARQAAIREALKKLNQEENSDGSLGDLEKLMEEMNKTETELYNKQYTEEMKKRQQEILTRLLDVEQSIREREQDEKRESKTADEIARQTPPSLEEYLRQREAEIQLYKTVPPALKPFYRQLIENYFKSISF
ncbi:MAG TPA: DUF4175 family protein [Chitinophagales bacterium]|nr:DUF4175 family protein [Chitinophagales bacterium]